MNSVEMLSDALEKGGKVRGFRQPKYREDGSLEGYARQLIEVLASDIVSACDQAGPGDPIVDALRKGSFYWRDHPEKKVAVQADDLFHLVEAAQKNDKATG